MERPLPRELRAVLLIFNANSELRRKALPHVDIASQSIDWESVLGNDYGSGHWAAIKWARAIWEDHVPVGSDPFDRAFAMDGWLRGTVLKALGIRWGVIE